jgi:hypothetical protein
VEVAEQTNGRECIGWLTIVPGTNNTTTSTSLYHIHDPEINTIQSKIYQLTSPLFPLLSRPRGRRGNRDSSFAWAEIYVCTATIFRRFDFSLHDTERARDVDPVRDCFLGVPSRRSQGVRVRVRELEVKG